MCTNSKCKPESDLLIQNGGSIFLLRPLSQSGRDWIEENINDDAIRLGNAIVVEHRYIYDIAAGATAAGLIVI